MVLYIKTIFQGVFLYIAPAMLLQSYSTLIKLQINQLYFDKNIVIAKAVNVIVFCYGGLFYKDLDLHRLHQVLRLSVG